RTQVVEPNRTEQKEPPQPKLAPFSGDGHVLGEYEQSGNGVTANQASTDTQQPTVESLSSGELDVRQIWLERERTQWELDHLTDQKSAAPAGGGVDGSGGSSPSLREGQLVQRLLELDQRESATLPTDPREWLAEIEHRNWLHEQGRPYELSTPQTRAEVA